MLSTQAQFNSRCADAFASSSSNRRSALPYCDDCPRRFGNRNRNSLSASARSKPFAPLFVPRRWKTFAPVNKGQLGAGLGSNIFSRWRNDRFHPGKNEQRARILECYSARHGFEKTRCSAGLVRAGEKLSLFQKRRTTKCRIGRCDKFTPAESASPSTTRVPTYKSPDGSFELILRVDPSDEDDQINGPRAWKTFCVTGSENRDGN